MLVRWLPLIAALSPLIGVHAAYLLGIHAEVVNKCIPYLEGCTSISATGRYMPGNLPFRATLFPQAAVLAFLWWFAAQWLVANNRGRYSRPILIAGIVGAVALILYVTFLGTTATFYEFMRRFGIYLYFLGTGIAQLLFTLALDRCRIRDAMFVVVLMPWVIGVANIIQKAIILEDNGIENVIEWWAALFQHGWYVLLFLLWRRDGIAVTVHAGSTSAQK